MEIPKSWNQITVSQFIELRTLRKQEAESVFEYQSDILSILTNEDPEIFDDMDLVEFNKLLKSVSWVAREPHKVFTKKINDYSIKEFKKVTWGEFIDLEHYYSIEYYDNLPTICGILYKKSKVDEWGVVQTEPYNYDPVKRGREFLELPITSIYGVATSYLAYRDKLVNESYEHIFPKPLTPEEIAELDEEDRKELEEEERQAKWSFERLTLNLAGGDITKMKDVFNLSHIMVLNLLSMQKE